MIQVSQAKPGNQDQVHALAAIIDRADSALGDFKRHQASAFRSLVEQEESLEEELAAVAGGILSGEPVPSAAIGKARSQVAPETPTPSAGARRPMRQAW